MIRTFSVKNFLSIRDKQTIDFGISRRYKFSDWTVDSHNGDKLSFAVGIFGANASGKTNMMRAISFFFHRIQDPFSRLGTLGWFGSKEDSSFELVVENPETAELYAYNLTISGKDGHEILSESLSYKRSASKKKWNLCFEREHGDDGKNIKLIRGPEIDAQNALPDAFPENMVSPTATVISLWPVFNVETPFLNLLKCSTNLSRISDFLETENSDRAYQRPSLLKKLNNDPSLLRRINKYVKEVDLGISEIVVEEGKKITEKRNTPLDPLEDLHKHYNLRSCHTVGKKKCLLSFNLESVGTREFFINISNLIPMLESGGLYVLDEIDAHLHPNVVIFLLKLFANKEVNKGKSQLIFSAHLPQIIDALPAVHTWLVEKAQQQSEYFPLTDIQGASSDVKKSEKYLAGVYGAVPMFRII